MRLGRPRLMSAATHTTTFQPSLNPIRPSSSTLVRPAVAWKCNVWLQSEAGLWRQLVVAHCQVFTIAIPASWIGCMIVMLSAQCPVFQKHQIAHKLLEQNPTHTPPPSETGMMTGQNGRCCAGKCLNAIRECGRPVERPIPADVHLGESSPAQTAAYTSSFKLPGQKGTISNHNVFVACDFVATWLASTHVQEPVAEPCCYHCLPMCLASSTSPPLSSRGMPVCMSN